MNHCGYVAAYVGMAHCGIPTYAAIYDFLDSKLEDKRFCTEYIYIYIYKVKK